MRKRFCIECFTKEQRKQDLPKFKDFSSIIKKKAVIKKKDPSLSFSILTLLGRGASGSVFSVQNLDSNSKHAMKIIELSPTFNKSQAINEIGLMQMTSHENIVRLEEAFEFEK
jgi:serine/threonine protein kinase